MKVLYATARQAEKVADVVEHDGLIDVVVKPAFMGMTLICCASDSSHDLLKVKVAGLASRGPG